MPQGYKVRLGDGSEIGPLDANAVREWYAQGLLDRESPVLKPGSKNWRPLFEAMELKDLRPRSARAASAPGTGRGAARAASPAAWTSSRSGDTRGWRIPLAGALLLAGAVAAGYWLWLPERWTPALELTPWREIALGEVVLGLLLVRGWEAGRLIVRIAVMLAAFVLFPLAGMLFVQGVRGRPFLVIACAWVVLGGFVALLAAALSPWRSAGAVALVLLGWVGIVALGLVPENPELARVRSFALPDRALAQLDIGVSFEAPAGWVLLRPDQPFVAAPPGALAVVAEPRAGGFGYLAAQTPHGVTTTDDFLKTYLGARAVNLPSFQEVSRADVPLGQLVGRGVVATWRSGTTPVRDLTVAVKSGWTFVTLVAWMPDDGSLRATHELEALRGRLTLTNAASAHLDEAVQAAARDVPHLSAAAAELVMSSSAAHVLQPAQAFRRAYELASRGVATLDAQEARELGDLTAAATATLARADRAKLIAYLDRVRDGRLTPETEDGAMAGLSKQGELRLPTPRLQRMQALYEKAIRASLRS